METQAEKYIEIPYEPRDYFLPLHESGKRWSVVVAHRRSGKTVATINHLLRDALTNAASRYAYIAPTYKQAKNIAWDILKEYSKVVPGWETNESELSVKFPNGSKITLYGADNPDSLRGIGLWGVVFDEYSQQPSNIFSEIIRPALADKEGYAIWIGTPKGKNEFWRLYELAKIEEDRWYETLLTVQDTKVLSERELEDAQIIMSEDEFNQEFMCSFEASIKGSYYANQLGRARGEGRIGKVPHDEALPVHTFWDLGIGDATSVIFMQNIDNEWRMIDYYENSGEGLGHYAGVLQEKAQSSHYIYGEHYAPHDIEVKELGTGITRKEIAKSLGISFKVAPKLSIEEGINAVRTKFSRLYIDQEHCARFLHCISLYHKEWDDKRGEFRDKPYHDFTSHAADALRTWGVIDLDYKSEEVTQFVPSWQGNKRIG
jgi:phage terminase large subunit